jgi:sugar phosphate isomerase/epimerase
MGQRIAISESCFPDAPRERAFTLAREVGADGIELIFPDARALAELDGAARADALAESARAAGVAIPSICLQANCLTDGLIAFSPATGLAMKQVRSALHGAVKLKAKVLLLPFYQKAAVEQEAELDFLCKRLTELTDEAEAIGVTIGVGSTLSVNQQQYLTDHAGGTGIRIYCDVGSVTLRRMDPSTEIRELGERICQVHFRDVRLRPNQPPELDLPLGQGQVDLPAVARSLQAIHYDKWVCLLARGGEDAVQDARRNVAFARKLLGA